MRRANDPMKVSTLLTQAAIFVLCLAHMCHLKLGIVATLVVYAVMQLIAVAGQWWGRRIAVRAQSLPLR